MSEWENLVSQYDTYLEPTANEVAHFPAQARNTQVVARSSGQLLLANWLGVIIYSNSPAEPWYVDSTNTALGINNFIAAFPHHEQITDCDPFAGTGKFEGKKIKWNTPHRLWEYLNHRTVHFNHLTASTTPGELEDDDTATVESLLQSTKQTLTAVTQELA